MMPQETHERAASYVIIGAAALAGLVEALHERGYTVVGPTAPAASPSR
jgi:phosphoribosylamine-glycine ligase